jgi:hypothetical protein
MEISPELEGQIENLIRAYCSESSEEPQYLKRLARQHNVLPIMVD